MTDSTEPDRLTRQARWGGRQLAWVEVLVVVGLITAFLWIPWKMLGHYPGRMVVRIVPLAIALVFVVGSFVRLRETPDELGLAPSGWKRGWRILLGFTVLSSAPLIAFGLTRGRPQVDWSWVLQYAPGLLLQQLALQCFFNNRTYYAARGSESRRRGVAVTASSLLFVIMHAPNPALMVGVTWVAPFWTWHFRRHRNLAALAVSHLILGTLAMALLGRDLMFRLRVGWPALKLIFPDLVH